MTRSKSSALRYLALTGTCAALCAAAQPALADDVDAASAEMTEGEKELAEMLEGRVAGEPVDCITAWRSDRMTVIDETAYVYGRGNTIYVQRTHNPESIDDDDVIVMRRFGSQICRTDQITTVDRFNGFLSGVVFFEEFTPYTRVEDEG